MAAIFKWKIKGAISVSKCLQNVFQNEMSTQLSFHRFWFNSLQIFMVMHTWSRTAHTSTFYCVSINSKNIALFFLSLGILLLSTLHNTFNSILCSLSLVLHFSWYFFIVYFPFPRQCWVYNGSKMSSPLIASFWLKSALRTSEDKKI